jgi:hypothetical protein
MHVRPTIVVLVTLAALGIVPTAHAQEEPGPAPPVARPWANGVTEADQAKALEIYEAGNAAFAQAQYAQALAQYQQAIVYWDHPAIRFNMAVCDIQLGQPLEAYDNVTRSLAHGPAPLDQGKYDEGLNYQKLLRAQIVELKVVCTEPGAEVSLDGARLFTGPGDTTRMVLPGRHQVVATKARFLTESRALDLVAGRSSLEEIQLVPLVSLTTTRRRFRPWVPWLVVGTGAAVALVGVPLQLEARSDLDAYDTAVAELCRPDPCAPTDPRLRGARDQKASAGLENQLAVGSFVTGGLVVAAGFALVLLNSPERVEDEGPPAGRIAVSPCLGPAEAGVTITLAY